MRFFLFLPTLLLLLACGNEGKLHSKVRATASEGLNAQSGTLVLPETGNPTIIYNEKELHMGTISPEVEKTIVGLTVGDLKVEPYSVDSGVTKYRVNFVGDIQQGACPLAPKAECTIVNLKTLTPY